MPVYAVIVGIILLASVIVAVVAGRISDRMKESFDASITDLKREGNRYYFLSEDHREIEVSKKQWLLLRAAFAVLIPAVMVAVISVGILVVGLLMIPSGKRIFGQ